MKTRTLAMMLTLVVAGLAIGCSSAPPLPTYTPYPTYTPAAPTPNFTEKEVIELVRAYHEKHRIQHHLGLCFSKSEPNPHGYRYFDLSNTSSASYKANGLWLVKTQTLFNSQPRDTSEPDLWERSGFDCVFLFDDATAKVRPD